MKPGNIIVADDPDGPYAYLTDFGLSKNPAMDSFALTRMGQMIGTLSYTAPEEILATEPRGHLVDIYSLGCVMYEALTGAPPFVRDRDINVLYAHVGDSRPRATDARSDLPAGIDDVIARAMAISAHERYPTCAEFIAAAEALLPREGDWSTFAGAVRLPPRPGPQSRPPSRGRRARPGHGAVRRTRRRAGSGAVRRRRRRVRGLNRLPRTRAHRRARSASSSATASAVGVSSSSKKRS